VRPLLKWAGGKRQLLPALRRFYPAEFGRYFEPFLGSGAVFFDLLGSRRLGGHRVFLTDSNRDLIGCYQTVRDHPDEVIDHLTRLADGREANPTEHFYATRATFNEQRATLAGRASYTPALAAMLIYLNRTAFNGLFRLNSDGEFNVPAGRYTKPRISDPALIHAVSQALSDSAVSLSLQRFETVVQRARAGDLLYFDPPYAPLSETARFTGYTGRTFTLDDHAQLRDVAVTLAGRGCYVMVSNSSAPAIGALYEDDPTVSASGLRVHRLPARRAINSRADARGPVTEFLLTNLVPRA
jgi:DNA adenine methylase